MKKAALVALLLAAPANASQGARDVRLLSSDQVGSCTRLGTVTETRASGRNPDAAAQKALSSAMDKAARTGANAGVIADGPNPPGYQSISLQTWHCADAVGIAPVN